MKVYTLVITQCQDSEVSLLKHNFQKLMLVR